MNHRPSKLIVALSATALLAACAHSSGTPVTEEGVPVWVDNACHGQPKEAICAVGQSDFAAADVEAAKTDAETAAKNRIVDQLQANVGRLTERLSSVMKDLANGKTYGKRTLKDINQNFTEMTLTGLRYESYHYLPDRLHPEVVYVRAILTVDTNKMSEDIIGAMNSAAAAEGLEFDHQAAQLRYEQVRKEVREGAYTGGQQGAAPAK
jgi:uncharacterized coiled-coil protein SlyX